MFGLDPLIGYGIGLILLALITSIVWFWPDELQREQVANRKAAPGWPDISSERTQELRNMSYREYLHSEEWSQRSLALRKQAGWRCEICGSGDRVQVHHRTYKRLGNERPSDLQVLCGDCHRLAHRDRDS
jgi:5-methylcytosine-specific restriction endonuclease McrA